MPKDMEFDFPPHQDYPFNQGSLNCVTLWIPFEDIDHKIGPVNIIPGSHLSGNIPTKDGTIKEFDEKKAIEAKAKLGEVVVFSQFMHHRSGKNISKNIRFSLQFRYNDLAHHEYAQRKFYINQKITEKTFDVQHETYFPDAKRK
jgi:ectoine hydroxylase-related dioxygenase (phytanoyl-CoA dioxygenase family)